VPQVEDTPLTWVCNKERGSCLSTQVMTALAPSVFSLGNNPTSLQPLKLSVAGHATLAPSVYSLGHIPPPATFGTLCGRA